MELQGFSEVSKVLASGVYALAWRGSVVYVGKSKRMLSRIEAHRSLHRKKAPAWLPIKGVQFDQVFVRPCPIAMLDLLEREMINLYKPRLNAQLKTNELVRAQLSIVVAGRQLTLNRKEGFERRL